MAFHGPDYSSSEDEFDDPDFKELMRQQKLERLQLYNGNLTEKQQKEQNIKKIQNNVINRNNDEVLSVINIDINLDERLEDEWTLILLAASVANFDLVVELHKMGADINLKKGGDTILMCACNCPLSTASFEESSEVIKFLIDIGVDVTSKNRKRMNALMFAASNGNINAVELLLPLVDLTEEDNQNWDALFWAVYSGNAALVEFLIDKGLTIDRVDLKGSTPLDIAIDNNLKDVIELLMPEENKSEDLIIINNNFEDIFRDLKNGAKPLLTQDICNILHGTRCENLMKLFVDQGINLLDFLTLSEEEFEAMGVEMPFQRRRLVAGIHKFHKRPFHPSSVPVVGKDEPYSNVDVAAAVFSAIKQVICMEAAFKYLVKNKDELDAINDKKVIEQTVCNIESKLIRLRKVANKLQKKAVNWDDQIQPVNIITAKSGKRWFPWRKAVIVFGIVIVMSVKLWKRPIPSII